MIDFFCLYIYFFAQSFGLDMEFAACLISSLWLLLNLTVTPTASLKSTGALLATGPKVQNIP